MPRPVLVTAVIVATFSASLACQIKDSRSLGTCVKNILQSSRSALMAQFDPLPLDNMNGTSPADWRIRNATMRGLGEYVIKNLIIDHVGAETMKVVFDVSWPSVVVNATGRISICKRIFGSTHCFGLTGRPKVTVQNPSAKMDTLLHLAYRKGRLYVTPSGTKITINLPSIKVEVNLNGDLGRLDEYLGFPSKIYASKLSTTWWKKNKNTIEDRAKTQLHSLIYEHLSPKLEVLLQGFRG